MHFDMFMSLVCPLHVPAALRQAQKRSMYLACLLVLTFFCICFDAICCEFVAMLSLFAVMLLVFCRYVGASRRYFRIVCPNLYFPGPWDHSNPVWTELSSNLSGKLVHLFAYCLTTEPQTFGKMDFNTFDQKITSMVALTETIRCKMS
jgi:hypothetical protein